jgi:hypothetical protein
VFGQAAVDSTFLPQDIEREAKIGQEKLRRDDKFEDKKPKVSVCSRGVWAL